MVLMRNWILCCGLLMGFWSSTPGVGQAALRGEPRAKVEILSKIYPHWNLTDPGKLQLLTKLHELISKHKNTRAIAVFDWDGTLYSEQIPMPQYKVTPRCVYSGWKVWIANHIHLPAYQHLMPAFRTQDGKIKDQILAADDFTEGRTNVIPQGYSKFIEQIKVFVGMSVADYRAILDGYLKEFPVRPYVYYEILDLMQSMIDHNIAVWILSGSDSYMIAHFLHKIAELSYTDSRHYDFRSIAPKPFTIERGRLIGNTPKLAPDGKFSIVLEDRFFGESKELYPVAGPGKAIAIKEYIKRKTPGRLIFGAGNSVGDLEMLQYVLADNSAARCLLINPTQQLQKGLTDKKRVWSMTISQVG